MNVDREEISKVICSKCGGKGKTRRQWLCSKCHGKGKLDWVENVVGKSGFRIKPGVYVQEIDLSDYFHQEYSEPWYAPAGFKRDRSKS